MIKRVLMELFEPKYGIRCIEHNGIIIKESAIVKGKWSNRTYYDLNRTIKDDFKDDWMWGNHVFYGSSNPTWKRGFDVLMCGLVFATILCGLHFLIK